MHHSPTPSVDPSELRPRKRRYWIAGIIAIVGILIGVGGGGGLIWYGASSFEPDTRTSLNGTGTATGSVRLTADQKWAVFSTAVTSWDVHCTATSGSNTASVTDPDETASFTENGTTWYEVARVKVPAAGTYAFSCGPAADATGDDVTSARYFVGDAPSVGTFFGGLAGGLAMLIGVPFIAIVITVIMSVVTAVKRANHRKRLLAERSGPPGPFAQGPYGR